MTRRILLLLLPETDHHQGLSRARFQGVLADGVAVAAGVDHAGVVRVAGRAADEWRGDADRDGLGVLGMFDRSSPSYTEERKFSLHMVE